MTAYPVAVAVAQTRGAFHAQRKSRFFFPLVERLPARSSSLLATVLEFFLVLLEKVKSYTGCGEIHGVRWRRTPFGLAF